MLLTTDWYRKDIPEELKNNLKQYQHEKNESLNYNNFANEVDTRWVGIAGELTFKRWLDGIGISYEHCLGEDKDDKDFIIGRLNVDVKIVSTKYEPKDYYGCDVVATQWEKIRKYEKINALVFGRYLFNQDKLDEVIIMGWLPVGEFAAQAKFHKEGDILHKFAVRNDMYDVQIKQLRPLIEIDRFS